MNLDSSPLPKFIILSEVTSSDKGISFYGVITDITYNKDTRYYGSITKRGQILISLQLEVEVLPLCESYVPLFYAIKQTKLKDIKAKDKVNRLLQKKSIEYSKWITKENLISEYLTKDVTGQFFEIKTTLFS